MARVNGFDVEYTNRGSWKANRSLRGKLLDVIPVAWDRDYTPGPTPSVTVHFKDPNEAASVFGQGKFIAAIARKRPESASSEDIANIFELQPDKLIPDEKRPENGPHGGILCKIVRRVNSEGISD